MINDYYICKTEFVKRTMKKCINFSILACIFLLNTVMYAQPGGGTGGGGLEGDDPVPAPINGQITFLVLSALFFVFYTLKTKKSKA